MRPKIDPDHTELMQILRDLTREDVDISARAVAARHSVLKHASNFTRNNDRAQLISIARAKQDKARAVISGEAAERMPSLGDQLARAKATIKELEMQREALVASHAACVRAVMRLGGMSALEKFWKDYKSIGDAVKEMGALPGTGQVIPIADAANTSKNRNRKQP